jgi:hypothetical protein
VSLVLSPGICPQSYRVGSLADKAFDSHLLGPDGGRVYEPRVHIGGDFHLLPSTSLRHTCRVLSIVSSVVFMSPIPTAPHCISMGLNSHSRNRDGKINTLQLRLKANRSYYKFDDSCRIQDPKPGAKRLQVPVQHGIHAMSSRCLVLLASMTSKIFRRRSCPGGLQSQSCPTTQSVLHNPSNATWTNRWKICVSMR